MAIASARLSAVLLSRSSLGVCSRCLVRGILAVVSAFGHFFAVWDASPSREEALKAHGAASQWADVHWEVTEGFESP